MVQADDRLSVRLNDAARMVGVTRRTLERAISQGELVAHKVRGSTVILIAELKRFVTANPVRRGA